MLAKGGSARRAAVEKLAESVGASVDTFYFAFGGDDIVLIIDGPDNESVAAVTMTVGASGLVDIRTTVLLTPEEVDGAAKKSVSYRGPGQ